MLFVCLSYRQRDRQSIKNLNFFQKNQFEGFLWIKRGLTSRAVAQLAQPIGLWSRLLGGAYVSGSFRRLENLGGSQHLIHCSPVEIQALPLGIEVRTLHRRQDHVCLVFRISDKEQHLARSAILENRSQHGKI